MKKILCILFNLTLIGIVTVIGATLGGKIPFCTEKTGKMASQISEEELNTITSFSGNDTLLLISDAIVTNSDGYNEHNGMADFRVFAENITDAFSLVASQKYSFLKENEQSVVFNAQKLARAGNCFSFKGGIASGGSGEVTLSIYYYDGESEVLEAEFTLNAEYPPIDVTIDITDKTTVKILVKNHSFDKNRIVFYDLLLEKVAM